METTFSSQAQLISGLAVVAAHTGHALARPINATGTTPASTWRAADMFMTGIQWNDDYWDDDAGYLITLGDSKGRYDNRHTGWYATQLLARNGHGDVERAIRVFDNLIGLQYKDPSKLWYGDYPISPSIPKAESAEMDNILPYKAVRWIFPYCSGIPTSASSLLAPGYRQWLYAYLLPEKTVEKVKKSIYLAAKGDLYRVGSVDNDNLYPAYSNPWIMRVIVQAWAGAENNDKNMTQAGEKFGKELYDLWSKHHTLSEFNSGTYSGVAMWALALWTAYAPEGSKLREYGAEILKSEWDELAELYNPNLKNVAGPWDRTYGFNMKQYANLVGAVIWGAVGREHAPVPSHLSGMMHANDFSFFPLIALSVPEMVKYLSDETREKLMHFSKSIISPRKLSRHLLILIRETSRLGFPKTPAVIQWAIDEQQVGCISHYVSQSSIHAVAGPKTLEITYPNATSSDQPISFTFLFSGLDNPQGFKVTGLGHLPGLNISVDTNASPEYTATYDYSQTVSEFWYYNITYVMPEKFGGAPYFSMKVQ
ncbi:hypothetical protein KEM54_005482 [Ascosphaera aggregata]|nr:hypothetical protein KEM54_005482 [Ascosphaera aggregata]